MARTYLSKSLAGTSAALLLTGCPDPAGKYDEFIDRTEGDRVEAVTCDPSGVKDVNGEFLLAISTVLGRTQLLQFRTDTQLTGLQGDACPAEGCRMRISAQPIVPDPAPPGCTLQPGTPVGSPIVVEEIEVSDSGEFVAEFGSQAVPGCGNPISGGDIQATITLVGTTVSRDLWAGEVRGMVHAPVQAPLGGSTFAAQRIVGDELPRPIGNCQEAIEGGGEGGAGGADGSGGAGGQG